MRKFIVSIALLSLVACQPDVRLKNQLVGNWNVSLVVDSSGKKSINESVHEAIDSGVDKAAQKVEETIDSLDMNITIESNGEERSIDSKGFANAMRSFAKGIKDFVKGMAEFGKGLAKIIKELVELNVELKADGSMQFSSPNDDLNVELNEENLKWTIQDGKFLLETESEVDTFLVEKLDTGFLLKGEEATIRLKPIEKTN